MGRNRSQNQVYIIDFGLCKEHLDARGIIIGNIIGRVIKERPNIGFRGTVIYASLNAHNKMV